MTRDDRHDQDVPEPDTPATAAEKSRAENFGRLIERVMDGDTPPPAMDSDERALVEVATMVVASERDIELSTERKRALIDQALERAVLGRASAGRKRPGVSDAPKPPPSPRAESVDSLDARRESRFARMLPWVVASVAAAAAVVMFVTRAAEPIARETPVEHVPMVPAEMEAFHRSRPADDLIGRIPAEQAGAASERLDAIYADRMAGYRDLMFRRRLAGGPL